MVFDSLGLYPTSLEVWTLSENTPLTTSELCYTKTGGDSSFESATPILHVFRGLRDTFTLAEIMEIEGASCRLGARFDSSGDDDEDDDDDADSRKKEQWSICKYASAKAGTGPTHERDEFDSDSFGKVVGDNVDEAVRAAAGVVSDVFHVVKGDAQDGVKAAWDGLNTVLPTVWATRREQLLRVKTVGGRPGHSRTVHRIVEPFIARLERLVVRCDPKRIHSDRCDGKIHMVSGKKPLFSCFGELRVSHADKFSSASSDVKLSYLSTPSEACKLARWLNFCIYDVTKDVVYREKKTFNGGSCRVIFIQHGHVGYSDEADLRGAKVRPLESFREYLGSVRERPRALLGDPDFVKRILKTQASAPSKERGSGEKKESETNVKVGGDRPEKDLEEENDHDDDEEADDDGYTAQGLKRVTSVVGALSTGVATVGSRGYSVGSRVMGAGAKIANRVAPRRMWGASAEPKNVHGKFQPLDRDSEEMLSLNDDEKELCNLEKTGNFDPGDSEDEEPPTPRLERARTDLKHIGGTRPVYEAFFEEMPNLEKQTNPLDHNILKRFNAPREVMAASCLANFGIYHVGHKDLYVNLRTFNGKGFPRILVVKSSEVWVCDDFNLKGLRLRDIRRWEDPLGHGYAKATGGATGSKAKRGDKRTRKKRKQKEKERKDKEYAVESDLGEDSAPELETADVYKAMEETALDDPDSGVTEQRGATSATPPAIVSAL